MSHPDSLKRNLEREGTKLQQDLGGDYGAGGINMILALLEGVLGGVWFWDDWPEPGGTNPCRTLSLFLGVLGGSWGGDWTSRIAWCKFPYSKESPRASGSLYPAEYGGAFLREREPGAIATKRSLVSSN